SNVLILDVLKDWDIYKLLRGRDWDMCNAPEQPKPEKEGLPGLLSSQNLATAISIMNPVSQILLWHRLGKKDMSSSPPWPDGLHVLYQYVVKFMRYKSGACLTKGFFKFKQYRIERRTVSPTMQPPSNHLKRNSCSTPIFTEIPT
ncbi:hypothetical protein Vretifemale_9843, partial [Volvox reticuliferus]